MVLRSFWRSTISWRTPWILDTADFSFFFSMILEISRRYLNAHHVFGDVDASEGIVVDEEVEKMLSTFVSERVVAKDEAA